ncbi:MAG TPA: hypothetical protein ENN51_06745 [candidate division WOR-3 bacterium]|uniref:ApeA N-terminal domain-containing protein n=1 Tax=candidate division WOR-3 bacterium TaxID=2052148 RepID=A0A7V0T6Q6_UNCW3|nr:hypothetical protein [candidate division WOR-3 bacterium]
MTGSFGDIEQRHTWPDVVLGELDDGTNATLLRCWRADILELCAGSAIPSDARFAAETALVGRHFDSPEAAAFESVEVSYLGLLEWLGPGAFSGRSRNGAQTWHHTAIPNLSISVGDQVLGLKTAFAADEDPSVWLNHEKLLYLTCSRNQVLPFSSWRSGFLALIRDFLTFAMRQDTPPVRIRAFPANAKPEEVVDIYLYGMAHPQDEVFSRRTRVLFWYFSRPGSAESALSEWLAKADTLESVRVLHCELLRRPELPIRLQFLLAMQSLEAFHRCTREGVYLLKEEWEPVIQTLEKAVKSAATGGLKDSLVQRLKYGNEYSLRKRLTELVTEYKKGLGDTEMPVGAMVDKRNELTHPKNPTHPSQAEIEDISLLTELAQALTEACLLSALGLSEDFIRDRVGQEEQCRSASDEWKRRHP